jgi:hypothetical protein
MNRRDSPVRETGTAGLPVEAGGYFWEPAGVPPR